MYLESLIHKGGMAMYPLLLFSVVAWCIFLERLFIITFIKVKTNALYKACKEALQTNEMDEAKEKCKNSKEFLAVPYQTIIDNDQSDRETIENIVGNKFNLTVYKMKRNLWLLGTIATIAPFIGLFGTIAGIMSSFDSIAKTGKSGFSVVAAGMSEALITTAAGIVVAVGAVIFFNFLQNQVNSFVQKSKIQLEELVNLKLEK